MFCYRACYAPLFSFVPQLTRDQYQGDVVLVDLKRGVLPLLRQISRTFILSIKRPH